MNKPIAAAILQALLDGTDPVTGEILPDAHVIQHPVVIRALHTAIMTLKGMDVPKEIGIEPDAPYRSVENNPDVLKSGRLSSQRPWTQEDIDQLTQLFADGWTIEDLAHHLQRRKRGVSRQLEKMGLIESTDNPEKPVKPGLERAGKLWTQDEDDLLRKLHADRWQIADIAPHMHRSEFAVFCRMEKLELYGEEYGYPDKLAVPFTPETRIKLHDMYAAGHTVAEIAAHFGQPEKSIAARLFYMGLSGESPDLFSGRK